jgi:hypothetical protein
MASALSPRGAPASPALPRDTTYQYGVRHAMREIEQGGKSATSLLVTRGHVEIEVFSEPAGSLSAAALGSGAVGTYTLPPQTRRAPPAAPSNHASPAPLSPDARAMGYAPRGRT